MDLIQKGNRHWQTFHSVGDLIDFVTADKYANALGPVSSGSHKTRSTSYEKDRFNKMIEMAEYGWPEGRDEIEKIVVELEKQVMGYLPVQEIVRDVTGQWLDVGAYLAGEPECFGTYRDTDVFQEVKKGRIIHMVLNIDVSWEPFKRGAAGVAIIDALERCGHRVQADAIANSTGRSGTLLETRVRVKESNEAVQLDKLAWLYAHPNIFRTILCACWERLPQPIKQMYGFDKSYGWIADVPLEDRGDIYVERTAGYYGSTNDVVKHVLGVLKEQGIAITEDYHGSGG